MVGAGEVENAKKMNGGLDVEQTDEVKWWDALETAIGTCAKQELEKGLQLIRECRHPDAQWMAALLPPPGTPMTKALVQEAMRKQGDDPRALYLLYMFGTKFTNIDARKRAAAMGYAPAQAICAPFADSEAESFSLAEKAAAQGDRSGLYRLGELLLNGSGCTADRARALEVLKRAATLGHERAQIRYGELAFADENWERHYWLGIAARRGLGNSFFSAMLRFLPSFENIEHGRILHTMATVLLGGIDEVRDMRLDEAEVKEAIERVLELHDAMLERARRAVDCWSMAAQRRGVVKDMRVVIAKMAWEEPWRWGEKEKAQEAQKQQQKKKAKRR
jgi:TPR repeat protein